MNRVVVAVRPVIFDERLTGLFAALGQLLPVHFVATDDVGVNAFAGAILPSGDEARAMELAQSGVACLLVPAFDGINRVDGRTRIQFGDCPCVEPFLRGQFIDEFCAPPTAAVTVRPGDSVAAACETGILWSHRVVGGSGSIETVAQPLPALGPEAPLRQHFNEKSFSSLLPLLAFLRRLTRHLAWEPPRLQASFIFDDPSLKTRSFGYIRFADLVRHAELHNYHVAIAIIPLDMGSTHPGTVELFKQQAKRLSLVIHGNNHVRLELARDYPEHRRSQICNQAMGRALQMERRTGLRICRVMEPPFGTIRDTMFVPLVEAGFEGVLITPSQFLELGPASTFPTTFGLKPVEGFPLGLAMVPRLRMAASWRTEALLAAFLGQPVVLAGHHQDAIHGYELQAEFARTVNSIIGAEWARVGSIARSRYLVRRDRDRLRVQLHTRHACITLPPGTRKVVIERGWDELDNRRMHVRATETSGQVRDLPSIESGRGVELELTQEATTLDVISPPAQRDASSPNSKDTLDLWPRARRLLTELRDRTYPLLHG